MDEMEEKQNKEETKQGKKGWTPLRLVALGLCCAVIGGGMGVGGFFLGNHIIGEQDRNITIYDGNRVPIVIDTTQIETGELMTAEEVYATNVNSTVGIRTTITTTGNIFGYPITSTQTASGSGFAVATNGYIVTNYHVVENSNTISVSLYNGESYDAKLVGYEESMDLAVLKIEKDDLVPVVLGNSDYLNVGETVVAIGNPLGELTFSLTKGAVSAKDREVSVSSTLRMNLIQTDCAINSGNSGGALFNMYGEVVGITNAKYSSSGNGTSIDNIGFAIPMNDVKGIIMDIIENGYYAKPYIGVSVTDVSMEAQQYGAPKGAAIQSVAKDSPAEKAGLLVNDIITKVNEQEITCANDFTQIVANAKVGDTMIVEIYRQGETLTEGFVVSEYIQSE